MAGRFELCLRRHNLTYGHHYEVASECKRWIVKPKGRHAVTPFVG